MSPLVTTSAGLGVEAYGFTRLSAGWRAIAFSGGNNISGLTLDSAGTVRCRYSQGVMSVTSGGVITYQKSLSGTARSDVTAGVDSSSNFYGLYGNGSFDSTIVKFDTSGNISWQGKPNAGGTNGVNTASLHIYSSNGNQYLNYHNNGTTTYLSKLTASGAHTWTRTWSWSGWSGSGPVWVTTDSSENVYRFDTFAASSRGLWLAKYNSAGTIQWQRDQAVSDRVARGIQTDSSGNVYTIFDSFNTANINVLSKLNTSGTAQWQRSMTGSTQAFVSGIAVDASGNSYVTLGDTGASTAYILKFDTNGNLTWQRSLTGMGTSTPTIILDSTGSFIYIGGASNIVKLTTDGNGTGTIYSGVVYASSTFVTTANYTATTWANSTATDASAAPGITTTTLTASNTTFTATVRA